MKHKIEYGVFEGENDCHFVGTLEQYEWYVSVNPELIVRIEYVD